MHYRGFVVLILILGLSASAQGQIFFKKSNKQPVYPPSDFRQPLILPPQNLNANDLEDFLEDSSERLFRQLVNDVDVDVNARKRWIEIEIDADHFAGFVQVQNYIRSLPHVAGYQLNFINRNLEDMLERSIKQRLGPLVDDVSVDVDERRRLIEVELELRQFVPFNQVQQAVATLPEVAGYALQLRVEVDD
jgi:hypothetical protein